MKDLAGKTAFVTGGASGIGLSMARAFGREGMNVVISDVDGAALDAAGEALEQEQVRVATVVCDVGDRASVQAAAQAAIVAFGKVHLVCNNAGVAVGGALGQVRQADWDWIFDVNIMGVVHGMETFAPLMVAQGQGGHFVNTASIAGFVSAPGLEPYSASKHAVVAMSEGWAAQLGMAGIGVSILCPHFVRTRIHESERARPSRYGASAATGEGAVQSAAGQAVLAGIDPELVGARVVEAVKAGELYVFTHPQARPILEAYFKSVLAGFDAADASPALQSIKGLPLPTLP
jgi:NAD(P)-dependent dehydrogenase (short-subunit alcohol dehydrogenase family)